MKDFIVTMAASASGMEAQSTRLRVLAENIANADTPGYRRKTITFESVHDAAYDQSKVSATKIGLDRTDLPKIHDPSHPLADPAGYYDGSNVNVLIEIADAREAQRSYEANLKVFEQARKMNGSLLELLRR